MMAYTLLHVFWAGKTAALYVPYMLKKTAGIRLSFIFGEIPKMPVPVF